MTSTSRHFRNATVATHPLLTTLRGGAQCHQLTLNRMTKRTVMNTVPKIMTLKPFFKHPSIWFEKNKDYAYLLHQDFKIREYMDGLFYRLRIPTSEYTFERYHGAMVVRHSIWMDTAKNHEMNRNMESFLRSKDLEQIKNILVPSKNLDPAAKLDKTTRDKLLKYLKEYQFEYWDKDEEFRSAAKNLWSTVQERQQIQEGSVSQREAQKMRNHLMKFFPQPMVNHFIDTMSTVETDEVQQLKAREDERQAYIEQFKKDPLLLKKQYVRDGYQKLLPHLDKLDRELKHRNIVLKKLDQIKSPLNYAFVDAVQQSLTDFASTPVYYLPIVHEKTPPINSARLVAEFIRHKIETGSTVPNVFSEIKKWQIEQLQRQRVAPFEELSAEVKHRVAERFLDSYEDNEHMKKEALPNMLVPALNNDFTKQQFRQFVNTKLFPLAGIRIQISGLLTAAARKQKVNYDEVVGHDYAGKMNHSAITADVDYYDTFARRNEGSLGIKVWLMFRTRVVSMSGIDRTMTVFIIPAIEQNFTLHAPNTYLPPKDADLDQQFNEKDLLVYSYEENQQIRQRLLKKSSLEKMEDNSWEVSRRKLSKWRDVSTSLAGAGVVAVGSSFYHGDFVLSRELRRGLLFGLGFFSFSLLYNLYQTPMIEKDLVEKAKLRDSTQMPSAGQRELLEIADRWVWDEDASDSENGPYSDETKGDSL